MKKLLLLGSLTIALNSLGQTNNYSIAFDGVDDEVRCPNPLSNNMNAISFMFYAKFSQLPTSDEAFVTDWPAGAIGSTFKIDRYISGGTTNTIRINLTTSTGSLVLEHDLQTTDYNSWNNWAFTYDGDSIIMFENGVVVEELDVNGGTLSPTDTVIRIGEEGNNTQLYTGLMDEFHIWDIKLTQEDVNNYIQCHPNGSEAGLIGYWNFEEGTGTTAADQTSSGNDGTLTNGPTWSTDVPAYNCGVGINETTISSSSIKLYPNPSNSSVTVQSEEISAGQISIIDILGATVYNTSFFSNSIDIDLNQIGSKGTYFVKVLDNEGNIISVEKLIYQ